LPVIPSLKLTDKGLVDVDKFELTNLWIDWLINYLISDIIILTV
jgi:hypothetical protein